MAAMSKVVDRVGVLLVCWGKVISGSSRHVTEPSEGSVRMIAQGTSGSSNLRKAMPMDEREGQIAQGSHNLRGMAGAQLRAILAKCDITHIMQAILNAPMSPDEFQQACRGGLLSW